MDWGWIARLFDPYERQARIVPALLLCLPAIVTVAAWLPVELVGVQLTSAAGVAYLGIAILATVARDAGKRIEPALYKAWRGVPTTQLLRHRGESMLDATTRQRIHSFLGAHVPGVRLPSAEEEKQFPEAADDVYSSVVSWLREQTRDAKKFPLVLAENIGYGFRRNAFGVRRLAIWVASTSLVLNILAVVWAVGVKQSQLSAVQIASTVLTAAMLLFWVGLVRESWVKEAAFAYAYRLLAACDSAHLVADTGAGTRTNR